MGGFFISNLKILKTKGVILSLFDYSGNWSFPFSEGGFEVVQVDTKLGINIYDFEYQKLKNVVGILAAVPCTDFSNAGAHLWKLKDVDGRTEKSVNMANYTLDIIDYFEQKGTLKFWVIENPVGRIEKLVPRLKNTIFLQFNPCDYGDGYTKKTRLWGDFNPFLVKTPVKPVKATLSRNGRSQGNMSIEMYYGVKSQKVRSITPPGFSKAFYEAQLKIL